MKIAVVTPIPTPYRDPFWNVVASRPGVELDVFYCAAGKADRPWRETWERNYRAEVLPGVNLLRWRSRSASCYWNPGVARRLREGRYDAVVVGGYNHPTMLAAIRTCLCSGTPYFLMCESYRRPGRSRLKAAVKDRLVRWVVSHAAGGFPTGTLAERYLIEYGSAADTLVRLPNVPDIERWERCRTEFTGEARRLRQSTGLENRKIVLFVGRLIAKKRPALAIRAFARAAAASDAVLVMLGDGPEKDALVDLATQLGVRDRVLFRGFVDPDEVVLWQSLAHVFLLPSTETWGVALLEAIAAGTPVVVSDGVGSHVDVVVDERLGSVVPAGDETATADALRRRLDGDETVESVRAAWRGIRGGFVYTELADRLCDAIAGAPVAATRGRGLPTEVCES